MFFVKVRQKLRAHATIVHLLVLLVLWALFFWRYFAPIPNRVVFPDGDFTQQFFMFRSIAYKQLSAGNLPLWSNCFFAGYPFHADPQAQLFYPPLWINFGLLRLAGYVDFPLMSLTAEAIFHYLAVSIFMYLFLREETGSRTGALVGSVVMAYGGYLTGYPPLQTGNLETTTWMPLIMLCMRRLALRGAWPAAAGAVAALAVAFFAGHPQTFLLIVYLAIAYFVFRGRYAGRSWAWIIGRMSVVLGLLMLVASVQLLPQAQFLSISTRTRLPFDKLANGFALSDLVQFLVTKTGPNDLWQPLYVGILGLVLALLALPLRRNSTSLFWLVAGIVALLLTFGGNMVMYNVAYWILPLFYLFRGQEHAAVLVAMAASTLAAMAASVLLGPLLRRQREVLDNSIRMLRNLTPLAFLLLVGSILLAQHNFEEWGHLPARLGLWVMGMLLTGLTLASRSLRRWFPALLVCVVALELFSANMATNASPPFEPYPHLDMLKPIKADASTGRWFRVQDDARMQGHWACAYGLKEWGGISPIRVQTWLDFDSVVPERVRFGLLGIDYLISWKMDPITREDILMPAETLYHGSAPQGEAKVYRLPGTAQRAWIAERVDKVASEDMLWEELSKADFDYHRNAVVGHDSISYTGAIGTVAVTSDRPGRIEMSVDTSQPALLVVSEAWYPGWVASTTTGQKPVHLVNGYVQGVYLEAPGRSQQVVLEYHPKPLVWGAWISALGVLLTLLLIIRQRSPS